MRVSLQKLAAERGFEPRQKASKASVLPLHNSAPNTLYTAEGRDRTDMRVAPQWFLRPSRLPIPPLRPVNQDGAEDEIRTRDLLLGKEAF